MTRLVLRGAHRSYRRKGEVVPALCAVDLDVSAGELVMLTGPSGSGKSTLLLVLAGWEVLDAGTARAFPDGERAAVPAALPWSALAIVPQALGLLPELTIEENIMLPARIAGLPTDPDAGDGRSRALMESLDVERLRRALATEVSMGEQQRAAVARALVPLPPIVIADEPSTHQDAGHGRAVFAALRVAADGGAAVVVATHDADGLRYADRVITMSDGVLRG
jgi:putative ABC transport system ATP-binding protein